MSLSRLVILWVVVLAACVPRVQAPGSEDPPVAPRFNGETILTADGTSLPLRVWAAAEPRAVFVALHGMNDYSNAFAMSGAWWADQAGITTYAYDQRGFGDTDQRGVWPGEDRLLSDLGMVVDLIRARHPTLPVYLLGHSMGAAVVMAAVAEDFVAPDGVILAAPAIWGWSALPFPHRAALWLTAHTVPWKTFTGGRFDIRPSDNIDMLRRFSTDPLVIKGTRADAIYGLVGLMDRAYKAAPQIKAPTLLVFGQKDEIIPAAPIGDVIGVLCRNGAQVRLYPNGYHMILRDLSAETVWRDIAQWSAALPNARATASCPAEEPADTPTTQQDT